MYDSVEVSESSRNKPVFRRNAINRYDWLKKSGMFNSKGLYTDEIDINDQVHNRNPTTRNVCNDMVYMYNQVAIFSGLQGLWEAIEDRKYLEDTEWTECKTDKRWSGLGRSGFTTEACDLSGQCNQYGHDFEGISFYHLAAFCESLPRTLARPGSTHDASEYYARRHATRCNEYTPWVIYNTQAALQTRDPDGHFGSWWSASLNATLSQLKLSTFDYRNRPTLTNFLDNFHEKVYIFVI
jgi:hypothetical protein